MGAEAEVRPNSLGATGRMGCGPGGQSSSKTTTRRPAQCRAQWPEPIPKPRWCVHLCVCLEANKPVIKCAHRKTPKQLSSLRLRSQRNDEGRLGGDGAPRRGADCRAHRTATWAAGELRHDGRRARRHTGSRARPMSLAPKAFSKPRQIGAAMCLGGSANSVATRRLARCGGLSKDATKSNAGMEDATHGICP